MTNYDRLSGGLKLYRDTMRGFIAMKLQSAYGKGRWVQDGLVTAFSPGAADRFLQDVKRQSEQGILAKGRASEGDVLDIHQFERVMRRSWDIAFKITLHDQKKVLDWVKEVGDERNTWAHPPAGDLAPADVNRVLDSCCRVLRLVDAAVATNVEALRDAGNTVPSSVTPVQAAAVEPVPALSHPAAAPTALEASIASPVSSTAQTTLAPAAQSTGSSGTVSVKGLPAWRSVIHPHADVQAGRYQQAEFAADLAQVLAGKAEAEYQDAVEFFRRTYMTAGMKGLLQTSVDRLSGRGGEPVIQLKTSFGGGKTHTMLALYHLVTGGAKVAALPGMEDVLNGEAVPAASIAVLVGTALDPARPSRDVTALQAPCNTLWGEMAFQLGRSRPTAKTDADREKSGATAFRIVQESDTAGTAPGSNTLVELFEHVGPCVVLIDELVAFIRNIREARGLPAGSFNANMTFVQNLTEAVKRAPTAVLVASIPESAIELGDSRGEEVARRIENTFGRLEAIWQPVAAHEGFEVVRRRLFGDVQDEAGRDATCRAFTDFYRQNPSDFPIEAREAGYFERMLASYPIHPEMFGRLYDDWSVLERFQRTRGVLRLMAATIHELWQSGDQSPLIMPGSLPLYTSRVRNELTRYLGEQWNSVVDQDVDGDTAEPARIDGENGRFGAVHAARRLARTVFLGSVPQKSTRGIEEVRIRLGAVQANESIAVYNDALGRLRDRLGHLYTSIGLGEGGRSQGTYWYAVQLNLNRTVADRSSKVSDDEAFLQIDGLLRSNRSSGGFAGIHIAPATSADVPDEDRARLVLLSPRHPHHGGRDNRDSRAIHEAQTILDHRGTAPRLRRNMLLFFAPDADSTASLVQETKRSLAWKSIVEEADLLNLDDGQKRQAKEAEQGASKSVIAKLDEAYKWVLVPLQEGTAAQAWEAIQLQGGALGNTPIDRASFTVQTNELLIAKWSPFHLKMELDKLLWKDGQPHIGVKQLWDYFATYLYLPRLKDRDVLLEAIGAGCRSKDFFGYADGVDTDGRYLGLTFGQPAPGVYLNENSVVVRPDIAQRQLEDDAAKREREDEANRRREDEDRRRRGEVIPPRDDDGGRPLPPPLPEPKPTTVTRYYGRVKLDNLKLSSSANQAFQEVVQHLMGLVGSDVMVSLDIEASIPEGVPAKVMRDVTENARTLRFQSSEFEE